MAVGVAARLAIARPGDLVPANESRIAAVFGGRVHALDRVAEQECHEAAWILGEDLVHLVGAHGCEVPASHLVERLQSLAVLSAQARQAARPAGRLSRGQAEELRHVVGRPSGPAAERSTGEDLGRAGRERAEHGVDVSRDVRFARSGVPRFRRVVVRTGNQSSGRFLDDPGLMRVEHEQGPAARLAGRGRRWRAASGQKLGRKQDGEAGKPRSLQHPSPVEDCHGQESSHHWWGTSSHSGWWVSFALRGPCRYVVVPVPVGSRE